MYAPGSMSPLVSACADALALTLVVADGADDDVGLTATVDDVDPTEADGAEEAQPAAIVATNRDARTRRITRC